MEPVDLRELLEQVQKGNLGIEAALEGLRKPAVADLGYAHVDCTAVSAAVSRK